MKINIITKRCLAAILATGLFAGCTPDEASGGNPLSNPNVDASFTVTADASGNHITATGQEGGDVLVHRWDIGNGQYKGQPQEEFFFPDAGTYTITHTVYGSGGSSNTSTQTVTVTTPDPIAGNLVLDGKFEDGQGAWQIHTISAGGATWAFANGQASISAADWNQQGIFQPVQVEAGAEYNIDMKVSGAGSVDTWFEVYVSPVAPVQGTDYSGQTVRFALNTWAGCATGPFDGMISQVGCGDHSGNPISFDASGTVYFIIKCGGGNVGTINVDNVEMRRVN